MYGGWFSKRREDEVSETDIFLFARKAGHIDDDPVILKCRVCMERLLNQFIGIALEAEISLSLALNGKGRPRRVCKSV